MKEAKCLIVCSKNAKFDVDEISEQIECYKEIIKKNTQVKFLINVKDIITQIILNAINGVYQTTDKNIADDKIALNYIKEIDLGESDFLVFVGFVNGKSFSYSVMCRERGIKIIKICIKENYGIFSFQ